LTLLCGVNQCLEAGVAILMAKHKPFEKSVKKISYGFSARLDFSKQTKGTARTIQRSWASARSWCLHLMVKKIMMKEYELEGKVLSQFCVLLFQ